MSNARQNHMHVEDGDRVTVRTTSGNVQRAVDRVISRVTGEGFYAYDPEAKKARHLTERFYRWNDLISAPGKPRPERETLAQRKSVGTAVLAPGKADQLREQLAREAGDEEAELPMAALAAVVASTEVPPAPAQGVRFSAWLTGWFDRSGTLNLEFATGVQINPNRVAWWKSGREAPTERDVVEIAAYFDRLGEPHSEGEDWLEAVERMVARDLAAGAHRPRWNKRSKVAAMRLANQTILRANERKAADWVSQGARVLDPAPERPQEPPPAQPPPVAPPAPPPAPEPAQAPAAPQPHGRSLAMYERAKVRRQAVRQLLAVVDAMPREDALDVLAEVMLTVEGEVPRG